VAANLRAKGRRAVNANVNVIRYILAEDERGKGRKGASPTQREFQLVRVGPRARRLDATSRREGGGRIPAAKPMRGEHAFRLANEFDEAQQAGGNPRGSESGKCRVAAQSGRSQPGSSAQPVTDRGCARPGYPAQTVHPRAMGRSRRGRRRVERSNIPERGEFYTPELLVDAA